MQDDSPEKKGIELSYDLGMVDMQHSPWSREPGGQLAVVFTPPFYPALVARVRFFVGIYGKPTTEFRVRIFRATATSGPEDHDLLTAAVTTAAPYGNRWVEVDLRKHEIIIPSGDFCVAMEWLTPPGDNGADAQYIGVDTSKPDKRSWWKTNRDTGWKPVEDIANIGDRDFMIRATVIKK